MVYTAYLCTTNNETMATATTTPKKPTMATVKSFINKNRAGLYINVKSKFDGMTDGCEPQNGGFVIAEPTERWPEHTKGVTGAWFVGRSDDYITRYDNGIFEGFEIYNSCGLFVLAVKK